MSTVLLLSTIQVVVAAVAAAGHRNRLVLLSRRRRRRVMLLHDARWFKNLLPVSFAIMASGARRARAAVLKAEAAVLVVALQSD